MTTTPLALNILWWAEVIISARVLFFTIPVLINGFLKSEGRAGTGDLFMVAVTMTAVLFSVVGVLSIARHPAWRLFQYLAAGAVFLLTVGLYFQSMQMNEPFKVSYLLPLIISGGIVLSLGCFKGRRS